MLLDRNIEPHCKYCRHGTDMGNDEIICTKRGIMTGSGNCTSFRYEPTKRIPEAAPDLWASRYSEKYSEEDFLI